MLTLANKITLFRIVIVPLIVVFLYFPGRITCMLAMLGFILAALSDMVDGHIARRSNTVTSFGKFLDPLADKLLISSVLVMLSALGWVPAWVVIVIICRELMVTGLRAIAADEGVVIAADKFGKMKTVLQMLALTPLLLHYPWFGFDPNPAGQFLLYMALILTVFSGGNYLYAFYKNWRTADAG
jgi:CDP-diacylglycerol--glycerol-3-phosphate 3-phosphatidyltransferase